MRFISQGFFVLIYPREAATPYSSEIYRIDYVKKDGELKSIFYNELGAVQKAPY
ncbi:MAG: hypothetical protein OQJ96_04090 [Flavobacteriales bacterium]|nr:hypothetical protein [Flavobacteriales bacterium]MCW8912049.1 hypothetical protein [Flavobacteriales bacterium]MCW8936689.1 hypothetical protein [Flavobacteriales bacterium]MCW8940693.1 hypothetical protein [Flavobacteriales bacterium]MCW8967094.1 hypothetical protein [Flavobacteriales bacterium]